jgi:hypothetical protein
LELVQFALRSFAESFACFAVKLEDKAKPQRSPSGTQSSAKKTVSVSKLHQ